MGKLCLSARDGDYIVLVLPDGRTVRVDVEMDVYHRKVKLHFDAPGDVRIYRDKPWESIQASRAPKSGEVSP